MVCATSLVHQYLHLKLFYLPIRSEIFKKSPEYNLDRGQSVIIPLNSYIEEYILLIGKDRKNRKIEEIIIFVPCLGDKKLDKGYFR